jgi:UDP-N-acetylglucosamine 2-epimerase (non-hydrolysing)
LTLRTRFDIVNHMPPCFKVAAVVGARPNFMKIMPVLAQLRQRPELFDSALIHTGQHYDDSMSRIFLDELGIGDPDYLLDVGSGSHARQTAYAMERIEPVLEAVAPDVVLVPGDINSTLAASLVAAKLGIPIGHIESGLRSFDRTMPEELNRILTDQLSDFLFIHSPEARDNLLREGCEASRVFDVGNTMIDMLVAMRERIEQVDAPSRYGLARGSYLVVTLHRPALVDGPLLADVLRALERVACELPVVFPVHPRTRKMIEGSLSGSTLRLLEPQGYLAFLSLLKDAAGALTDSGGIQEETTFLGVPCFTLRANTERPVTCTHGTNVLLGLAPERIRDIPACLADSADRVVQIPSGWDGAAAARIVDVLEHRLARSDSKSCRPARPGMVGVPV